MIQSLRCSAAIAAVVLVAACGGEASRPLSVTERDTLDACRQHADQVYNRLNRATIYNVPSVGTPGSSTGLVGNPTESISERYVYQQMIDRCVRDTGAGTRSPEVPNTAKSTSTP